MDMDAPGNVDPKAKSVPCAALCRGCAIVVRALTETMHGVALP
jgi:hypothetical protein